MEESPITISMLSVTGPHRPDTNIHLAPHYFASVRYYRRITTRHPVCQPCLHACSHLTVLYCRTVSKKEYLCDYSSGQNTIPAILQSPLSDLQPPASRGLSHLVLSTSGRLKRKTDILINQLNILTTHTHQNKSWRTSTARLIVTIRVTGETG